VWHHPFDVACLIGLRQHGCQAIDHKIKEDGGEWVALTHTPNITEKGPDLTVNVDSSLATHDQLHQAVDHHP
jgi:hypothetical protein